MRHVAVVLTSRPSFARIKTVLEACEAHRDLRLTVIPAASAVLARTGAVASELTSYQTADPIACVVEGNSTLTSAKTTALLTLELAPVLKRLRPDVVVTIADRHETLGTAIAATYQNLPLAHIQGGEVTGNIDNRVRHTITMMADLHFPATADAADRITRMTGSRHVYHVGCPSVDLAHRSTGPPRPQDRPYVVVLHHPETTSPDAAYTQMRTVLRAVAETGLHRFVVAPGDDAGATGTRQAIAEAWVTPIERLSPGEMYRLVKDAVCLVGNSSLGIRECGAMGVWAVNIGARQEGRERAGNVIDVTCDAGTIADAIRRTQSSPRPAKSQLYGIGNAGRQIADILSNWSQ